MNQKKKSEIRVAAHSESRRIPAGWVGTLDDFERRLYGIFADERRRYDGPPGGSFGYCKVWAEIDFGEGGFWHLRLDVDATGTDSSLLGHFRQVRDYYQGRDDAAFRNYSQAVLFLQGLD